MRTTVLSGPTCSGLTGRSFECNRDQGRPKSGPRAIPTLFLSGPRAPQEASKRLSEGFRVEDAMRIQFWTHFWLQKESLRLKKSKKNLGKTMVFKKSAFSALTAFRPRFSTLLASLLGVFWPPRWLKSLLEFLLERPRAVQGKFFSAPNGSKSAPRGKKEGSKKGSKNGPKPRSKKRWI